MSKSQGTPNPRRTPQQPDNPRPSSMPLIIGVIVVALVLVGGVIFILSNSNNGQPTPTAGPAPTARPTRNTVAIVGTEASNFGPTQTALAEQRARVTPFAASADSAECPALEWWGTYRFALADFLLTSTNELQPDPDNPNLEALIPALQQQRGTFAQVSVPTCLSAVHEGILNGMDQSILAFENWGDESQVGAHIQAAGDYFAAAQAALVELGADAGLAEETAEPGQVTSACDLEGWMTTSGANRFFNLPFFTTLQTISAGSAQPAAFAPVIERLLQQREQFAGVLPPNCAIDLQAAMLAIMDEYIAAYLALAQSDRTAAQAHLDAIVPATDTLAAELAELGITGILPEN